MVILNQYYSKEPVYVEDQYHWSTLNGVREVEICPHAKQELQVLSSKSWCSGEKRVLLKVIINKADAGS